MKKRFNILMLVAVLTPMYHVAFGQYWNLTGNAGTGATNFVGTTDAQPLLFKTNATEAMRITSAQLVGIGTAAPAYKLQIANSASVRSLSIDNTTNTNSTKYGIYNTVNNTGTGGRYGIYNSSTSNASSSGTNYGIYSTVTNAGSGVAYGIYSTVASSGTGTHYGIYSSASGTSNYALWASGRAYFSDKVGLGITSPEGTLHIENNEVDLTTGGSIIIGLTSGSNMAFDNNEIHARNNGAADALYLNPLGATVIINNAGTVEDASLTSDGALRLGAGDGLNVIFDNNEIQARNNGAANNLTLNASGGNVNIGTFNGTEKLNVCGGIKATEVRVESGWCDYVFAPDYKLRSIDELASFISENNHLPNIPKASEVESGGLAVGDMSRRMMEKIEELTLYLIQQNEQIKDLQSENEKMQARINELMTR